MFLYLCRETMFNSDVKNLNQRQQFTAVNSQQGLPPEQQLAMQANPELLKQNVQDSYVANRVSDFGGDDPKDKLIQGAIAIPAWYGIATGMDKYAARSRGDYEKTIQHTVGNFGDKIANSGFFQSSPMKWLNKKLNSAKIWINNNIIEKTKLTEALRDASSKPELGMVRAQAEGMVGIIAQDYVTVAENFLRESAHPSSLASYGATKSEIEAFERQIGGLTGDARRLAMQKAECETILKNAKNNPLSGATLQRELAAFEALDEPSRLLKLKDLKTREMGLTNFAEFEKIKNAPHENLPRIMEASHNSNRKMYSVAYENKKGALGWIKRKLFNRSVYFTEISNKMAASLGDAVKQPEWKNALTRTGLINKIPKTALGRALAKFNNVFLESATNRVAGGKLAALFQAVYLAEVIHKTATHEGGFSEKAKSFAERLAEMVSFFACIPLGLKLMHKIGGLQYIGMTKDEIKDFRQALQEHKTKALTKGGFADKQAWKGSSDKLLEMLKLRGDDKVKNPLYKLLKKIGRVVTVGLEQIRPYDANPVVREGISGKLKDLLHNPKFGLKQMAGYPVRIILGMAVILPFLSKLCIKATHLLVGKPQKSILDEDKEDAQSAQNPAAGQTQLPPQLEQQIPFQQQQPTVPESETNLLNKYQKQQQPRVNGDTNTYIPSTEPFRPAGTEPYRSYIPSPAGVQITKGEDLTAYNMAMQKADAAERLAMQTLKMN